ncbi:MAG TPA: hypothetical protein DEB31_00890 [Clostridiales bacterium]|nr:hypothetical protein [Clostridiales bacterium]
MGNVTYTAGILVSEAMALMGESAKFRNEYMEFAVSVANNLAADCFAVNNAVRQSKGKERLSEAPVLYGEGDAIPYEYETLKNIMVYGMAFWLLYQDGELTRASAQHDIYEENKARHMLAGYDGIGNIVG